MYDYTQILEPENFVKFPDADNFTELDAETRDLLRNSGVYGHITVFPYLTPAELLQRHSNTLIKIGQNHLEDPYCIDVTTGNIVGIDHSQYVVNTSLKTYLDCCFLTKKFVNEVIVPSALGNYWMNRDKYANKLTEILKEVEPNVNDLTMWGAFLEEKRNGNM